jgi:hypothetical protein
MTPDPGAPGPVPEPSLTGLVGSALSAFLTTLVIGAINGALTLTGLGGLVSFMVGATGFGAVLENWLA